MAEKRVFMLRSMASVLDQALLSGLNLLIGLALIRYASKETYGLYAQLFAAGLLTTTLLDALIGTALTTLSVRLPADERTGFVSRVARIYWVVAALLAVIAGVVLATVAQWLDLPSNPVVLGLAFTVYTFAQASRQYCRTALFIEFNANAVVKMDLVFVLVTVAGSLALYLVQDVGTHHIFFLLALANGVASLAISLCLWRSAGQATSRSQFREDGKLLWSLSRWAVVGSVVGWLGNNSYLYFSGALVSVAALADLSAARLLLMPVVIVGTAWVTLALPAMGYMIANSEGAKIRHFVLKSTLAMEALTLVYVGVLWSAFPWLVTHVFGGKYNNITHLMLLWGGYFMVFNARNVTTVLLTSYGAFRELFWQGVLSLIILLAATLSLAPTWGVAGALVAMILVELWELGVNYAYLLPRVRRHHLAPS